MDSVLDSDVSWMKYHRDIHALDVLVHGMCMPALEYVAAERALLHMTCGAQQLSALATVLPLCGLLPNLQMLDTVLCCIL